MLREVNRGVYIVTIPSKIGYLTGGEHTWQKE